MCRRSEVARFEYSIFMHAESSRRPLRHLPCSLHHPRDLRQSLAAHPRWHGTHRPQAPLRSEARGPRALAAALAASSAHDPNPPAPDCWSWGHYKPLMSVNQMKYASFGWRNPFGLYLQRAAVVVAEFTPVSPLQVAGDQKPKDAAAAAVCAALNSFWSS